MSTQLASRTVTKSDSINVTDQVIYADASSRSITLTLPPIKGRKPGTILFHIKRVDSSGNTVTVSKGHQLDGIDGSASYVLESPNDYVVVGISPSGSYVFGQTSSGDSESGISEISWGDIVGTLSNQTDLNNALSGKASTSHSHAWGTITGSISSQTDLNNALSGKAEAVHTHQTLQGGCVVSAMNAFADSCGTACGNDSHADSFGTTSGYRSHADSYGIACGNYSHADSCGTACGSNSHSDSCGIACGDSSHADSCGAACGSVSHSDSYGIACGVSSHADSSGTACGDNSHANSCGVAWGYCSHANSLGTACGRGSFAAAGGLAVGVNSASLGSGAKSHQEGIFSFGSGMFSGIPGTAQKLECVLRNSGSSISLYLDGSMSRLTLPVSSSFTGMIFISGIDSGGGGLNYTRSLTWTIDSLGNSTLAHETVGIDVSGMGASLTITANGSRELSVDLSLMISSQVTALVTGVITTVGGL